MERLKLIATAREKEKKASNLRSAGMVPAVLYNHGNTESIKLDSKEVKTLVSHGISESELIDLHVDGKVETAFLKDYQLHPVSNEILHLDFYRITYGEKVKTHIPIHLTGKAAGVAKGGVLEVFLHEIEIETLPKHLKPSIDIDISALEIGEGLHIENVELPPDTRVLTEGNPIICHVSTTAKMLSGAEEDETSKEADQKNTES